MENWKERFRNQFVDTYGEKDSKEWRIAYQPIEELEDFISKELDKAREEGREEIRQLLRDKKQMQDYLKKNPRFYKGEKIPTATSNLLKTKEDEK